MSEERNITKKDKDLPERVSKRPMISPAVDIFENSDEVLLLADVPGSTAEGFNIHYDKDQLFIEATVEDYQSEDHTPLFREFRSFDYRRVFELAPGIDVEKISADLNDGVLSIHLPKSAAIKPRRISITTD
jgi:HSP20 family molecular chaperone IbpA